jgi:hypothetical protein
VRSRSSTRVAARVPCSRRALLARRLRRLGARHFIHAADPRLDSGRPSIGCQSRRIWWKFEWSSGFCRSRT